MSCSGSAQCLDRGSKEEQMECADKCVEHHMEREQTKELQIERRKKMEETQEEAPLSVASRADLVRTCVLVVAAGLQNFFLSDTATV